MSNLNICLYGRSGTFKTTQIGFLARYIYEKTGKPLRLVSADGGGWRPILPEVEAGLIEVFSIRNEINPIYILHKICEGYWPIHLINGIKLDGKMSKDTIDNVGGYAFEGITTISELMMDHLAGRKLGMNPAYSLNLTSSGESITSSEKGDLNIKKFDSGEKITDEGGKELSNVTRGAYSQDHYGFVQKEVVEKIVMSWNLPVELVIWTSHEASGEDEVTKTKSVNGPALVGKKGTAKIGRNVGMMIHAEPTVISQNIKVNNKDIVREITQVRYHFMSHADQILSKVTWEAKPRIPASLMDELLKVYPEGFFIPKTSGGLDEYIKLEDKLLSKETDSLKEWKKKMDLLNADTTK